MKSYCMKCQKEVSEDTKQCECGGRAFAYGDKFHFKGEDIACDCGSTKFVSNIHMDYKDKSVDSYSCAECKNPIGTEIYRSEESMVYWDN